MAMRRPFFAPLVCFCSQNEYRSQSTAYVPFPPKLPEHLIPGKHSHKAAAEQLRKFRDNDTSVRFMRQDVLTGKWTLYRKGGQLGKPRQVKGAAPTKAKRIDEEPPSLSGCPFCAGDVTSDMQDIAKSSADTGDVLRFEVAPCGEVVQVEDMSKAGENKRAWVLRVVRNIFPVVSVPRAYYEQDGNTRGFVDDLSHEINPNIDHPWYQQIAAVGHTEVIVEGPKHNKCIALQSEKEVKLLIQAFLERGRKLRNEGCVKHISYFKQHKCGSLVHAHSQIITTPMVPSFVDNMAVRCHAFQEYYNMCAVCRIMVANPEGRGRNFIAQERLVFETAHFVVTVPYASRGQYRLLIAPRRHDKDFLSIGSEEAQDLARVLQKCCKMYYHNLDDIPWNLAIYTCPVRMDPGRESEIYEKSFHWHAALYPRIRAGAPGFKLATDIAENEHLPEDDAADMRKWLAESPLRYSPNP